MSLGRPIIPLTPEEYLQYEQKGDARHEYINGFIYAMGGASRRHNLIATALLTSFQNHLDGTPCRPYMADMKLRVKTDGMERFYYPDIMVSCDPNPPSEYYEDHPSLLVEILSKSTEARDRLEKLAAYSLIPSLKEYLLVAQDSVALDVYRRVDQNWVLNSYEDGEVVKLESIDMTLDVRGIYRNVKGKIL